MNASSVFTSFSRFALTWRAFLLAIRPLTLPAAFLPVGVATAWALRQGEARWFLALACLCCALSLQIACNLLNDDADYRHGVDTKERLGPLRVCQSALLPSQYVWLAGMLFLLLAAVSGLFVVVYTQPIFLLFGMASLLAAWGYTSGPWPLSYHALGELFVFLFFGLLAVEGSYMVQSGHFDGAVLLLGQILGFAACTLILVNNIRDRHTDAKAGKYTLVHFLGDFYSRLLFCLLFLGSYATLFLLVALHDLSWVALGSAALPSSWLAFKAIQGIWQWDGRDLNKLLTICAFWLFSLGIGLMVGISW